MPANNHFYNPYIITKPRKYRKTEFKVEVAVGSGCDAAL